MAIIVSLDAGTTGVRALAIDETSTIRHVSYRELTQHYPQPGWVEHDLDEIWTKIQTVIAELMNEIDEPVAAIGITNQRETVAAWNKKTGRPLHRAIVWQDRRTAERCELLAEQVPMIRSTTGLVADPYFSATKYEWLLNQGGVEPEADLALGTIDSWLIWNLTGGTHHYTEPSNASRTMLFDINSLGWSDEMCELFSIPRHSLAEVVPSSSLIATTADTTALGAGIAISGVAGDQQAALFGQACFQPGMTKNTYGTGSFVVMNTGHRPPPIVDGLLTTVGWTIGDNDHVTYAYEGAIFVTGAAIQWLRDGLQLIESAPEIGPLAASVDSTNDVFMVPAFAGLGSPWWDPWARGTIVGITGGTTKAHLARAVVESMAYQTRDVVEIMAQSAGLSLTELRVDGGASVMDLLLQFQADQLGVDVTRPRSQESTAVGAAYLAGLAVGVWGSTDEITEAWALDRKFTPAADRGRADQLHRRWRKAVTLSTGWAREAE